MNRIRFAFICASFLLAWCNDGHATAVPTVAVAEEHLSTGEELKRQSEEMARLSEEIERRSALFNKRPRRKFISASVQQPEYKKYHDAWVARIENIGNQNYPEAARRLNLSGRVIVTVSIGRNGELIGVEINKSSGSKILDDAAILISTIASPYPAIPSTDDVDILSITRTWDFKNGPKVETSQLTPRTQPATSPVMDQAESSGRRH